MTRPQSEKTTVIRPSAVLPEISARKIVAELEKRDVANGGVWNASVGLWIRYDRAWDGQPSGPGSAVKVGSIGAMYGSPGRYDITIYRASLTQEALEQGWTVDGLVDDALQYGDLTLARCPRTALIAPPEPDPFRRP